MPGSTSRPRLRTVDLDRGELRVVELAGPAGLPRILGGARRGGGCMIKVTAVARSMVLIGALGGPALSGLPARAQERRGPMGPLRVHPMNPRYFADGGGRAIFLAGSHTWANLQDQGPMDPPRPFDYEAYLDFL